MIDNELVTKDFVRAELSKLDKKFTIYFIVVIATIIITNPNALELIQRIFGLVK